MGHVLEGNDVPVELAAKGYPQGNGAWRNGGCCIEGSLPGFLPGVRCLVMVSRRVFSFAPARLRLCSRRRVRTVMGFCGHSPGVPAASAS